MTAMAEPVLVGLLFADRIITENNGKKGIIGIFNRFMAKKFPVTFPPWAIYAGVTNLEGPHTFELDLGFEEDRKKVFTIKGNFEARTRRDVIDLIPVIQGVIFERPGVYYLTFAIDDMPIGGRILNIHMEE